MNAERVLVLAILVVVFLVILERLLDHGCV
jgi:hypothetical protein